MYMRESTCW